MNFSPEFWQAIQTAFETAILAGLTAAIPIIGRHVKLWLEGKNRQQQLDTATKAARAVVLAVEQVGGTSATAKKREAMAELKELLAVYGIQLEDARLCTLIEAVVYQELNRWHSVAREMEQ